ncbi:DDE-type integrase/transposase/recombinase [Actinoplanes sp. NPDC051861]|uniref:DDE-type integrase/transposase/recombinase n=1 Tax=Actinoplanes sp. NPDC051861 TaxID=3155170 RepID=UPI003443F54F
MHDDLVKRDFTTDGPNRLWLADITEHRTGEGKLYLCAIKDVWSNRTVGYSIDSRMKSRLAVNALRSAVTRRGDVAGCVLHTDRGSQFRSRKLVRERHRLPLSAPDPPHGTTEKVLIGLHILGIRTRFSYADARKSGPHMWTQFLTVP